MNTMQQYAIANPLARASGSAEAYRSLDLPWSLILTVNK